MRTVPFSKAKANLSALIDAVEAGESIDVTRHGEVVARIVPPATDDRERARRAVAQLKEWRRTLPVSNITIDDLLSARDEGRK